MNKYGISLTDSSGRMYTLREMMVQLREKLGGLDEAEQGAAASAIFGNNAMAGWLAVINGSDEDFQKLADSIDNCDGTAESMAETMQDNLSGQITILKSQLQELAISFGDMLMPRIRKITKSVQNFVDRLNHMSEAQRNAVLKIMLLVAAIGPFLLILGKSISTVGIAMQGFSKLGKGIMVLSTKMQTAGGVTTVLGKAIAFITSPLGIAVAALAVLAAAFIHLWQTNRQY